MFARALANTVETEAQANPELTKAKQTIKELPSDLVSAEQHLADAEARARAAEQLFESFYGHWERDRYQGCHFRCEPWTAGR